MYRLTREVKVVGKDTFTFLIPINNCLEINEIFITKILSHNFI